MDVILLGELENKLDSLKSDLSKTIGSIDTNLSSVKSLVDTNNTANKTGVLSQKLSYLITQNEAHGSLERTTAGSQNWTCPSGVYKVLVTAIGGGAGGQGARNDYDLGDSGGPTKFGNIISANGGGIGATGGETINIIKHIELKQLPGKVGKDNDGRNGGAGGAGIGGYGTGGNGGYSSYSGDSGGDGGGSGAYLQAIIETTPGTTYALTVGAGGAGGIGNQGGSAGQPGYIKIIW